MITKLLLALKTLLPTAHPRSRLPSRSEWQSEFLFSTTKQPGTHEKRWVDGVLGRKNGLGLGGFAFRLLS